MKRGQIFQIMNINELINAFVHSCPCQRPHDAISNACMHVQVVREHVDLQLYEKIMLMLVFCSCLLLQICQLYCLSLEMILCLFQ